MNAFITAEKRKPATLTECQALVRTALAEYELRTKFVRPSMSMIDNKDLDGTRIFLENVLRAWRRS